MGLPIVKEYIRKAGKKKTLHLSFNIDYGVDMVYHQKAQQMVSLKYE
jgi:hypothetical protein